MHASLRTLAAALLLAAPIAVNAQAQPPQAVNQQDEVINIAVAPGQSTDDAIEILRSNSKFETNDYVTEAVEVFNTEAYELKLTIQQAVEQEKGIVRAAAVKGPDGSSRYFLVVTTTPEQLPSIVQTIRQLDIPGYVNSQGRGRVAVRTKYRRASEVGNLLKATRLTSLGRVVADDATNTLYYDDTKYVINATQDYLTFFDVPVPQIEFDVRIIEVREDNIAKVGVDWEAWKRTVGGQFGVTGNYFEGGEGFARLDALLTLDAAVLADFLNYTVQSGTAEVLQRSRLNASNLEPAVISDFRRLPYFDFVRTEKDPKILTEKNPHVDSWTEYSEDESAASDRVVAITSPITNRLVDLTSEEEGLLISIAPIITTESVLAEIDIALNTVTGFDRLGAPIVTEQNLANRFTLHNHEELLLGSLERRSIVEARRGIPGLKDIPVIKHLFSVETERIERSRLFILATPQFSNTGFEAKSLADLKSAPTLRYEPRDVIIEDGGLDQVLLLDHGRKSD